jgi:hypothetical protein
MSDKVKIVTQTIYIYVFIDGILQSIGHQTDKRAQCSDSEIITTAMIYGRIQYIQLVTKYLCS